VFARASARRITSSRTLALARARRTQTVVPGSCSNGTRVRRDALEAAILDPVRRYYAERVKTQESRSAQIPHELQQLDARLVRLRERLQRGDPDLEPDGAPIAASDSAKVLSMLPKAAALYRKQIDGRPRWGHAGRPQGTCNPARNAWRNPATACNRWRLVGRVSNEPWHPAEGCRVRWSG
jgi:hypothetical protein